MQNENDTTKPETECKEEPGEDCQERLVSGSYTPGPWVWTENQEVLNSASGIVIDYLPYEGMWFARDDDAEDEANARLIAAAPDLLEALQNLENAAVSIPDHAWKICKAAISKAISSANAKATDDEHMTGTKP